jgi:hypothetical protein
MRSACGYRFMAVVSISLVIPLSATAQHVALPPVNLGDSAFTDGIGGPGLLVQETLQPYYASRFSGDDGRSLPGNNLITTLASSFLMVYVSEKKLFGGFYGVEILIPMACASVEADFGVHDNRCNAGDVVVSPFILQWPVHNFFGKAFAQRFDLDVHLPTGQYSRFSEVNIGSNIFSVNPYYSFTFFVTNSLEVSGRVHYLWNSKNDQPNSIFQSDNIQPGQAVHFNAAASYGLASFLRVGLACYFLRQITDQRIGLRGVPNSRERVSSIGPGFSIKAKSFEVSFYVFRELEAKNRPQGVTAVIQLIKIMGGKSSHHSKPKFFSVESRKYQINRDLPPEGSSACCLQEGVRDL